MSDLREKLLAIRWTRETLHIPISAIDDGIIPLIEQLVSERTKALREAKGRDNLRKDSAATLLTNLAQMLDVVKGEWAEEWSAWDQEQRDGITKWLTEYYDNRAILKDGQP